MNFNEALLESMIYALAYVECVAKRYSWPPLAALRGKKGSAQSTKLRQHSEWEHCSSRLLN